MPRKVRSLSQFANVYCVKHELSFSELLIAREIIPKPPSPPPVIKPVTKDAAVKREREETDDDGSTWTDEEEAAVYARLKVCNALPLGFFLDSLMGLTVLYHTLGQGCCEETSEDHSSEAGACRYLDEDIQQRRDY
jgi:hypothetical protein